MSDYRDQNPSDFDDLPPALQVIAHYIRLLNDWPARYQVIQEYPMLLSEEVDILMAQLQERASGEDEDGRVAAAYADARAFLQRAREVGLEQAYAEKLNEMIERAEEYEAVLTEVDDLSQLSTEERTFLEALARRGITTTDLRELTDRIGEDPELIDLYLVAGEARSKRGGKLLTWPEAAVRAYNEARNASRRGW